MVAWPSAAPRARPASLTVVSIAALVVFGRQPAPQGASIALLLLVIAALGGFYLASHHLRKHPGPKTVVVIHAGVAVVGFLLLANAAFGLV